MEEARQTDDVEVDMLNSDDVGVAGPTGDVIKVARLTGDVMELLSRRVLSWWLLGRMTMSCGLLV